MFKIGDKVIVFKQPKYSPEIKGDYAVIDDIYVDAPNYVKIKTYETYSRLNEDSQRIRGKAYNNLLWRGEGGVPIDCIRLLNIKDLWNRFRHTSHYTLFMNQYV